jgi:hypothetical protein
VRKELKRRNPGFDGQMRIKIEGGVVTEFKIVTDQVTDISPIRAFNALQVLECTGTYTDKPNGLLADLTPLAGMNLAGLLDLNLVNTKVSDAGMVCFKDSKNLTALTFGNTPVSDAGLANFKGMRLREVYIDNTGITDLTPHARHAAGKNPSDPEEHHPGAGHPPRHEEPQDHRHPLETILAGGGVLGALRQGGVQGVARRLAPTIVLAAIPLVGVTPSAVNPLRDGSRRRTSPTHPAAGRPGRQRECGRATRTGRA